MATGQEDLPYPLPFYHFEPFTPKPIRGLTEKVLMIDEHSYFTPSRERAFHDPNMRWVDLPTRLQEQEDRIQALQREVEEDAGALNVWRRRTREAEEAHDALQDKLSELQEELQEANRLLGTVHAGPSTVDHQFPFLMRLHGLIQYTNGLIRILEKES